MKLLSAYEDFVKTTLARISTPLGRLRFISAMREGSGYQHWGLSKLYGREAAQKGIAEAHSDAFEQVLTTPVSQLAGAEENQPALPRQAPCPDLLPADPRGGSRRHLNWILRVVCLLNRSTRDPNRAS